MSSIVCENHVKNHHSFMRNTKFYQCGIPLNVHFPARFPEVCNLATAKVASDKVAGSSKASVMEATSSHGKSWNLRVLPLFWKPPYGYLEKHGSYIYMSMNMYIYIYTIYMYIYNYIHLYLMYTTHVVNVGRMDPIALLTLSFVGQCSKVCDQQAISEICVWS